MDTEYSNYVPWALCFILSLRDWFVSSSAVTAGSQDNKPQQTSLWAAHGARVVSVLLVELVATFVKCVDLASVSSCRAT